MAFVLSPMIERAGRQVIAIFLHRPAFWCFIVLGLVVIWASQRLAIRGEVTD
jgi:hypothetical protein